MRVAQMVFVCRSLLCLIVEARIIVVGGLLVFFILSLAVLTVEQEEIAYRTAKPHFFSVDSVCLDIFLALPIIELFVAESTSHTLFNLRTSVFGSDGKVFAYAIYYLVYGVYGIHVFLSHLFGKTFQIFLRFLEFTFCHKRSRLAAKVFCLRKSRWLNDSKGKQQKCNF